MLLKKHGASYHYIINKTADGEEVGTVTYFFNQPLGFKPA